MHLAQEGYRPHILAKQNHEALQAAATAGRPSLQQKCQILRAAPSKKVALSMQLGLAGILGVQASRSPQLNFQHGCKPLSQALQLLVL